MIAPVRQSNHLRAGYDHEQLGHASSWGDEDAAASDMVNVTKILPAPGAGEAVSCLQNVPILAHGLAQIRVKNPGRAQVRWSAVCSRVLVAVPPGAADSAQFDYRLAGIQDCG